MLKNIATSQPNDFCVNKLYGFDPNFSEESFKIGLKFVGCVVKELWIFNHLLSRLLRNNDEEVGLRMKHFMMYNIDQVR